jgi:Ras-related protein Rab-5C
MAQSEGRPQAKAVLIGSMAVGKTAMSNRIIDQFFESTYQATVAVGYSVYKATLTGHPVELQLWDTAGMERYTSLGPIYYQNADAAIFVYDLTRAQTAVELDGWVQGFTDAITNPFYGVVVANKIDLAPDEPTAQMEEWAASRRFGFIRTSAKTGENVDVLFEMAVQGAFLIKNTGVFQMAEPAHETPTQRKCC